MGTKAEEIQGDIATDEEQVNQDESKVDVTDDTEVDETESEDTTGDGQEESEDDDELEEGTQPDKDDSPGRWLSSRLNRYKGKVAKADEKAEKFEVENKLLKEQNALKDLALEQAKAGQSVKPASKPNPEDFDGGVYDTAFVEAHEAYTDQKIEEKVNKQVAEATRQTTTQISEHERQKQVEQAQVEHVKKAVKLKIDGYEETEDQAIEILGLGNFNYIISNIDDSPLLLNYLGKKVNQSVAHEIAEVAKTNPAKAGIIIGGIMSKLKASPGKSQTIPPPDTELDGGAKPKGRKRGPKGATYE